MSRWKMMVLRIDVGFVAALTAYVRNEFDLADEPLEDYGFED